MLVAKYCICTCFIILGVLYYVKACGENYYQESGVIHSPRFKLTNYPHSYRCTWTLHAPIHKRIKLNVTHFQLEYCENCSCDFLIIRDGGTPSSHILGKFCGYSLTGIHYSSGNALQFQFHTDGAAAFSGYEIYFESILSGETEEIPNLPRHGEEPAVKPSVTLYENKLLEWFYNLKKDVSTVEKWRRQAPRIATALYCQDHTFFNVNNKTGDELRYEIAIQAMNKLSQEDEFSSQELALHINAMLVSCLNPRMFYGHDLIEKLRRKVRKGTVTNPYELLVLCNAGDNMTSDDIEKIENSYKDSEQTNFWLGTQAIASMALTCILNKTNTHTDEAKELQLKMVEEIKAQQSENGSFGSVQETALSLQAIIAAGNLVDEFDLEAAIKSILEEQNVNGSFGSLLDSYYVLPVLNHKSLVDINTDHCTPYQNSESKRSKFFHENYKLKTQLKVEIWNDMSFSKTWNLNIAENGTLYDVLQRISFLDSRFEVKYNVKGNKPFISAIADIENDPELRYFWFTYVKKTVSLLEETPVKESPLDVPVQEDKQFILRYKNV